MRQGCILTYQRRFHHKVHEKKNGQANGISQHLNVEVEANKGEDSKISTYNEPEKAFNEEKKRGENTMKHEPLEMETGNHVVDLETVGIEEGIPSQEKANVVLVDEANEDTDALGYLAVSPIQFELHAGSANKRPPEYIYLPNGSTLHDVMNACKLASPNSLEEAIQVAIGGAVTMPKARFCRECKGQATSLDATMLCDSCVSLSKSPKEISESSDINARMLLPGSSEKSAIVKSTSQPSKSKSQGKLTRK